MIDTIRFEGKSLYYKFDLSYEKFVGYRKKTDKGVTVEKIQQLAVEDRKGYYRVYYNPNNQQVSVELNIQKLIFKKYNHYNYEKEPHILLTLIRHFGSYFFANDDYYISRIDLGTVATYENSTEAALVLDKYRYSKPKGARSGKWRFQNFGTSVFYPTKNYSIKVYNKGAEYSHNNVPKEGFPIDLDSTLRFEKTYRIGEMKRIGLQTRPYMGCHIQSFELDKLIKDYYHVFDTWTLFTNPVKFDNDMKGQMLMISVMDSQGILEELIDKGVVKKTSAFKYKKLKKEASIGTEKSFLPYKNNLLQKDLERLRYVLTFGALDLLK